MAILLYGRHQDIEGWDKYRSNGWKVLSPRIGDIGMGISVPDGLSQVFVAREKQITVISTDMLMLLLAKF